VATSTRSLSFDVAVYTYMVPLGVPPRFSVLWTASCLLLLPSGELIINTAAVLINKFKTEMGKGDVHIAPLYLSTITLFFRDMNRSTLFTT
jgi:hypothetical protein